MSQDPKDAADAERRPRRPRSEAGHARPSDSAERRRRPREAEDRKPVHTRTEADEGERRKPEQRTTPDGLDARGAVRRALEELTALTDRAVENVVGIERDDDAWTVTVEVLEDAHIPSTSDILAEYEVRLSADGDLLGYSRGRRYVRGRTEA